MKPAEKKLPVPAMRRKLLDWYDRAGRSLPWRVRPEDRAAGQGVDPYAVWLSEIMLQQTTVPHATPYYAEFLRRWPTVHDLAAAADDDILAAWSGLGYYARARNLIVCAREVSGSGGKFPSPEKELLALPGIGSYTAAAIRAAAFDLPANVVDGNVERVIARLHALETPLPKAKPEIRRLAGELADPARPGDYAQALMDLGAVICRPRSPDCEACPWSVWCRARRVGAATDYPRRLKRAVRPTRCGVAFAVLREQTIWLRKRPSRGLLGSMLEVPSTPWREAFWPEAEIEDTAPLAARWTPCGEVRHVFTHFNLELGILKTEVGSDWIPLEGSFHGLEDLDTLALPSLMRKVIRAVLDHGSVG